jgi:hypothetical protein
MELALVFAFLLSVVVMCERKDGEEEGLVKEHFWGL